MKTKFCTPVNLINTEKVRQKNHTHVKKVEHTSEFLFDSYWWTWKTNMYLKNCWSGPIKNKIISTFTMLHFKKNKNSNTWRYHYQNLDKIINSSWYIEQNRLKLAILDHFLPFIWAFIEKTKISKKWKQFLEKISFYNTCVP